MPRIFSWLFRWSLELTGSSILLFNYQSYDRQQHIIGMYNASVNSIRTIHYLYGVYGEFKDLMGSTPGSEGYSEKKQMFMARAAERVRQLCEVNQGVYARMGQIMSTMSGVFPQPFLTQFKELQTLTPEETSYESIKTALSQSLKKPMKQLFDGFQTKPFSSNLFYQTHKSILLQNYKESLVKVMLPSVKYQTQYDLWFINKAMDYLSTHLKQTKGDCESLDRYENIIKKVEEVAIDEINFQREVENADRVGELIYEVGSSFYVPYYYKKLSNSSVVIRQFVEGVELGDGKGLKELGVSTEVAYAYMMSEIHRMMNQSGMINRGLNERKIVLRKYIKPAKRDLVEGAGTGVEGTSAAVVQTKGKGRNIVKKGLELIHPPYQVVFLSMNSLQVIPTTTREEINNFWVNIKKNSKKKLVPSVSAFYGNLTGFNNIKSDPDQLQQNRYYLYEPMLNLYEKFVTKGKGTEQKK